jgi:hypothetical protein
MNEKIENKTARVKVNFTVREKDLVIEQAKISGQSVSDFIRKATLRRRSSVSVERAMEAIWLQGLLLEQLENIAAFSGQQPDTALILTRLSRIETMINWFAPAATMSADDPC